MAYLIAAILLVGLGWILRVFFLNKQITNLKQEVVDAHTENVKAEADYESSKKRVLDIIAARKRDEGGSSN